MFIFSIRGWWTWPNTPRFWEWSKPSWVLTLSCWTHVSSVNTRRWRQRPSMKEIKANLARMTKKKHFLMWHGTRIWGLSHFYCLFSLFVVVSNSQGCVFRYWGIDGGPVLSVWLALDDSLKENGALQVIPGSFCSCFSTESHIFS